MKLILEFRQKWDTSLLRNSSEICSLLQEWKIQKRCCQNVARFLLLSFIKLWDDKCRIYKMFCLFNFWLFVWRNQNTFYRFCSFHWNSFFRPPKSCSFPSIALNTFVNVFFFLFFGLHSGDGYLLLFVNNFFDCEHFLNKSNIKSNCLKHEKTIGEGRQAKQKHDNESHIKENTKKMKKKLTMRWNTEPISWANVYSVSHMCVYTVYTIYY